jgi:hypothetical protein
MHSRSVRLAVLVAITLAALALTADPAAAASALAREYELKAAFLCNFIAFVEWPENAVPDSGDSFVIGVLGDDPFGQILDEIAAVKAANGTPIVVHRFATIDEYTPCHILFVAASEHHHLPALLETLGDSPVLVVGDTEDFARAGGIVNLIIKENKIRFEINLVAATRAGLKISSKLLRLAKIITEEEAETGATPPRERSVSLPTRPA